jgi:hypothetical protein
VASHLEPYLGPLNAKVAVKTFAQRTLQVGPEALQSEHVPALLEGLRPMLHTFVGRASTDALLDAIRREVK